MVLKVVVRATLSIEMRNKKTSLNKKQTERAQVRRKGEWEGEKGVNTSSTPTNRAYRLFSWSSNAQEIKWLSVTPSAKIGWSWKRLVREEGWRREEQRPRNKRESAREKEVRQKEENEKGGGRTQEDDPQAKNSPWKDPSGCQLPSCSPSFLSSRPLKRYFQVSMLWIKVIRRRAKKKAEKVRGGDRRDFVEPKESWQQLYRRVYLPMRMRMGAVRIVSEGMEKEPEWRRVSIHSWSAFFVFWISTINQKTFTKMK